MLSPSVGLLHGYREPVYVKVLYSPLTCLRLPKGTAFGELVKKWGRIGSFAASATKTFCFLKTPKKNIKINLNVFIKYLRL